MKYVVLVVVLLVVLWLMFGRSRRQDDVAQREARPARVNAPATMLACAHCGVHLPQPDALFDAAGRPYCGEPHRLAGPRT
jgi:uncharacterized protein